MKKQTPKTRKNTLRNIPDISVALPVNIQAKSPCSAPKRDPRIPPVGTVLTKKYKEKIYQVVVQGDKSFEYEGEPEFERQEEKWVPETTICCH